MTEMNNFGNTSEARDVANNFQGYTNADYTGGCGGRAETCDHRGRDLVADACEAAHFLARPQTLADSPLEDEVRGVGLIPGLIW